MFGTTVKNRKDIMRNNGVRILIQMLNEEKEYQVLLATAEALAALSVARTFVRPRSVCLPTRGDSRA